MTTSGAELASRGAAGGRRRLVTVTGPPPSSQEGVRQVGADGTGRTCDNEIGFLQRNIRDARWVAGAQAAADFGCGAPASVCEGGAALDTRVERRADSTAGSTAVR